MEEYLEMYGFHFNKPLFEFAVSMMEDRSGSKLQPWDKQYVEEMMRKYGIHLNRNKGHDAAYVANMARADYAGSSIIDDAHLMMYVRDYLDDIDGSPTRAFDEFYINCVAKGIPIFWDEML